MQSIEAARSPRDGVARPPTALALFLGIFSLGLGIVELVVPHELAWTIGIVPTRTVAIVVAVLGIRQILAGIAVLAQPDRAFPLWTRVAGDAMDLALLMIAFTADFSAFRLVLAILFVAGIGLLDLIAASRAGRHPVVSPVIYSVTINRRPDEVYGFYRNFERLPLVMDYLDAVEVRGQTSHWVANLPIVGRVEWDARIVEDRPGELIAWETLPGSDVDLRGRIMFAHTPGFEVGHDLTEVRVEMQLGVSGIAPNIGLAKVLTKAQVKGDLRRLKQVLETGEVLYSDASEHRRPHPAQPARIGEHVRPLLFLPPNPRETLKGIGPRGPQ